MTRAYSLKEKEEKHLRLVEDYLKGRTLDELKELYGYEGRSAVRYVLVKHGVYRKTDRQVQNDQRPVDAAKVLALQKAGWSMDKIVDEFGYQYTTAQIVGAVKEYRRKYGKTDR